MPSSHTSASALLIVSSCCLQFGTLCARCVRPAITSAASRFDTFRIGCAVDLGREPALTPVRRSNGVGLANYQVGWFRLKNGQRALCFLTRRDSVLYLPTKKSFVLLLSTSEPEQLLAALGK